MEENVEQLIADNQFLGEELMRAKFQKDLLEKALMFCLYAMEGSNGIILMESIKEAALFARHTLTQLEG